MTASPAAGRTDGDPPRSLQRARDAGRRWAAHTALTLLVADADEPAAALVTTLARAGIEVTCCADGAQALLHVGRHNPDVLLVATRLPLVPAPTIVAAVRHAGQTPILLGVGVGDSDAAGPALLAGATGVVQRPYEASPIIALLDAHRARVAVSGQQHGVLRYGPLELDSLAYSTRLHGSELDLPFKEFALLRLLMLHADHVVSPDQIREALWGQGPSAPSSNAVVVHVARLRARLGGPQVLRTVRGFGYRLTYPPAEVTRQPGRPES